MFNWFKKKKDDGANSVRDFSAINSHQKAIDLYDKGELVKIHLMPLEFGGEDIAMNVLYAPEFVATFKGRFDKMIEQLLIEGKRLKYSAEPEYKGESFIPSKLHITVSGDSNFQETITIW